MAACFAAGGEPWPHIALPLAMLGAGAALHLLAKGYLVRRARVTREGPYRWVRHPFYLANLLLEPGLLLYAGAWWALPVYAALAVAAYGATLREEEGDLEVVHGDAWRDYAARTPALIPFRPPGPRGDGPGFSLRNLLYEREIPRLLRLLSIPLALTWWSRYLAQPEPFSERPLFPPPADEGAMLVVGFISAQVLSWILAALMRAPRLDGTPRRG